MRFIADMGQLDLMPPKVIASAPSQAFLFGEHAVLYKKPALAAAVERRAYAETRLMEEGCVLLSSTAFSKPYRYRIEGGELKGRGERELAKLAQGIAGLLSRLEQVAGVEVRIDSKVPVGSGMASSASVAAAISKSVSTLFGRELEGAELLNAVYGFEKIIHGKASKTGPACAVFGGVIWVEWRGEEMRAFRLEESLEPPLIMACTGESTKTKEMIALVSYLYEMEPSLVGDLLDTIKGITIRGRESIARKDLRAVGRLMNINHGLLAALGVSSPGLERLVMAARREGALGSKLSGGGGGGCIVAVSEDPQALALKLKSAGIDAFTAPISRQGARVESLRD